MADPVRGVVIQLDILAVVNVTTADPSWQPGTGLIFVPHETASMGDRYNPITEEVVVKPSPYHVYDEVNYVWVLDYDLFNPGLENYMSYYRDDRINNASEVTVTFDEGGPNEEDLSLMADSRTLEAINRKIAVAPIRDDSMFTVSYKFKGFTPKDADDKGYRTVETAFLQSFYLALDAKNQKYFDAERYVFETHAATPYTSIQDASDDFDDYILNN